MSFNYVNPFEKIYANENDELNDVDAIVSAIEAERNMIARVPEADSIVKGVDEFATEILNAIDWDSLVVVRRLLRYAAERNLPICSAMRDEFGLRAAKLGRVAILIALFEFNWNSADAKPNMDKDERDFFRSFPARLDIVDAICRTEEHKFGNFPLHTCLCVYTLYNELNASENRVTPKKKWKPLSIVQMGFENFFADPLQRIREIVSQMRIHGGGARFFLLLHAIAANDIQLMCEVIRSEVQLDACHVWRGNPELRATALGVAADQCESTIPLRVLLSLGVDPNDNERASTPALMRASMAGKQDAVEILVAAGADVNRRDGEWSPLTFAALRNHHQIIRILLRAGASPHSDSQRGARRRPTPSTTATAPLAKAAEYGHVDSMRVLLDEGRVDVDEIDVGSGMSALMHAVPACRTDSIAFLLERGADVHLRTTYGVTSSQLAVYHGHTEALRTLIARGASPEMGDLVFWAKRCGDQETAAFLESAVSFQQQCACFLALRMIRFVQRAFGRAHRIVDVNVTSAIGRELFRIDTVLGRNWPQSLLVSDLDRVMAYASIRPVVGVSARNLKRSVDSEGNVHDAGTKDAFLAHIRPGEWPEPERRLVMSSDEFWLQSIAENEDCTS